MATELVTNFLEDTQIPSCIHGSNIFPHFQDRFWALGMFLRGSHVKLKNNILILTNFDFVLPVCQYNINDKINVILGPS